MIAVMLTVLASLGPIVAFFAASTTSYPFMLLLNVVIFSVAGFLGLRYMLVTLQRLTAAQVERMAPSPPVPPMPGNPAFPDAQQPRPLGPHPQIHPSVQPSIPQAHAPQPQPVGALEPLSTARAIAHNVRTVFAVWMVVFALVGSQMAWVLRPFLGHPNTPFTWLRGREANFFEAVFHALRSLFS